MADPEDQPPAVPALRASDADRERTADELRRHTAEGRLDPDELDERLSAAFAARTTEDLVPLTADLPAAPAPAASGPHGAQALVHAEAREALRGELVQRTGGAGAIVAVCVVVWLATGPGGHFWPMWVILGLGIGVAGTSWRGLGPGGDPVRELERAEERRDRRAYHDPHRKHRGPHF